ncbi:MAG TPA: histidine--tRNA ligase [Candidatus Acidoferrales bacterium]|nr:histidine--tRNA ligase [Candidatus Acidoferrales bacterium]
MSEASRTETERRKFRAIKGTRDILPPDTALWNWFEKTARSVMESYNYAEIRTPIFEETELFARSIGAETDVVNKEMYIFPVPMDFALGMNKHNNAAENVQSLSPSERALEQFQYSFALRPEATASVCRAYIEHGMQTLPGNQKLYYVGPMFRRERPQKGRYRQFYQIGAEVLGTSDAPAIDAELIQMLTDLLERCQIEKYTLLINSIGCPDTPERKGCRPKYVELLRAELREPKIFSKLGADSQRRVETNPLRVMDSKLSEEQPIIEKLPKISEHLCADCRAHYEKLKHELTLREVDFTEAPRLVRGLDYYMRTTFEITSPILGAQNALCGGGRYDGLVEMLGGPKGIKGIGFALGEDRFIEAIVDAKKIHATRPLDIFIAWMGDKAYPTAVRLAHVLRGEKHTVELPPEEMKFRKALERADKLGARFVLILGEDEIKSDTVTIKQLSDGKQEKISEDALVDYFRPK